MLSKRGLKEIYDALFYIADTWPRGVYYQRYEELAERVLREINMKP